MAPNKKDISKIGQEAFALLDEQQLYGEKRSPCVPPPSFTVKTTSTNYLSYNQYQPQTAHIIQFKPTEERVINSYEAVQLHGGVLICDYYKRKPKAMPYYY
ncbi:hypothetical protein RND71_025918 [Anisodus tanguticus]|uniref:Uncharacterized protein n=1 Tax=Anisodus tanguticus TaxID=243964 RepID=A0AAE1V9Y9_9SOLA|nr:hypothetical protein RND71_025918 [Anisodus tanguticus]